MNQVGMIRIASSLKDGDAVDVKADVGCMLG